VEWRMHIPKEVDEKCARMSKVIERRYGFYEAEFKNAKEIVDKYGYKFFELLDECYKDLYGTMPFSKKLVDQTIGLFKLVLDKKYISIILDKEGEMAGFGVSYASLATALQKSKGRYLPFGWIRMLRAIKKPKRLELALIAVKPKYQRMGVTAIIINNMMERIIKDDIEYADTGCQLETNTSVINALDMIPRELVRRKVCYIKKLEQNK